MFSNASKKEARFSYYKNDVVVSHTSILPSQSQSYSRDRIVTSVTFCGIIILVGHFYDDGNDL